MRQSEAFYPPPVMEIHGDKCGVHLLAKASTFIKWPILPKIKETHFKVINKMYPVAELLKKRFGFEVDQCSFCSNENETVEHLFFLCPITVFLV